MIFVRFEFRDAKKRSVVAVYADGENGIHRFSQVAMEDRINRMKCYVPGYNPGVDDAVLIELQKRDEHLNPSRSDS